MGTYPNKRGRFRKTGMIPSFDTLFLPDKELKKTNKKRDRGGYLNRKIVRRGREHFFESLALADRNHNFLEHAVGDEFES
jgi:hypothetical protein